MLPLKVYDESPKEKRLAKGNSRGMANVTTPTLFFLEDGSSPTLKGGVSRVRLLGLRQ